MARERDPGRGGERGRVRERGRAVRGDAGEIQATGTQAGRVEVAGARASVRRPCARPPGKEKDDRGGARWAGLALPSWLLQCQARWALPGKFLYFY